MIRVTQEFGAHAGRKFSFDEQPVRIGRAPTCEIAFDPNVDLDASGVHCEVVFEHGAWFVADANSRNGTWLNGTRITRQRLQNNDVLECGRGGPRLRFEIPTVQPTMMTDAPMPLGAAAGPGFAAPVAAYSAVAGVGPISVPPSGGGFTPQPASSASAAPFNLPSAAPFAPQPAAAPAPVAGPLRPPFGPVPGSPLGPPAGPPPGPQPQASFGANVAQQLPAGSKVGARTVGLMIDQALKQAGMEKGRSNRGVKTAVVGLGILVVAGLGVGAFLLFAQKEDNDRRMQENSGNAGERIAQDNDAAIYLLAAARPMQRVRGFCTGFAVTQTLIATNAHCVELAQTVVSQGGQIVALRNNGRGAQVPVSPVYRDPRFHNPTAGPQGSGFDVGVMQSQIPLPATVRLATNEDVYALRPGAQIFVFGFPGMTMNETSPVATITSGILNRSTDFFERAADPPLAQRVQHSAQTTSGSSGSPIFLSNGLVIGVNAGSLADDERQNIVDPTTGRTASVEVNRSSNFKYGMRTDLIREAIQAVGQTAP